MTEQEQQKAQPEEGAAPTQGETGEMKDAPKAESATPAEGEAKEAPKAEAATPAEGEAKQAPKAAAEKKPARREAAAPAGPSTAVVVPRRVAGQPIVSRRSILKIGFWSSLGALVAGTVACSLDLIYPRSVGGFGGTVAVNEGDVPSPGDEPRRIGEGKFWLVNLTQEQGGPGLLALWWKCPHLGCTVPWKEKFVWPDPTTGAPKEGWFRCPCHGSTYTRAGVRVFGPAPRSLDTMAVTVENGRVIVDTGNITNGAPDNPDRVVRI